MGWAVVMWLGTSLLPGPLVVLSVTVAGGEGVPGEPAWLRPGGRVLAASLLYDPCTVPRSRLLVEFTSHEPGAPSGTYSGSGFPVSWVQAAVAGGRQLSALCWPPVLRAGGRSTRWRSPSASPAACPGAERRHPGTLRPRTASWRPPQPQLAWPGGAGAADAERRAGCTGFD